MRVIVSSTTDEFTSWLAHAAVNALGPRWSARSLARHTKLSPNTVSAVVHGKRVPTERVVGELAPVLGVSEEEFKRQAGITPLLDLDLSKSPPPLTENERITFISALEQALAKLRSQ
jgi:transcriptional regulator with XRE-family HTH domain